MTKRCEIEVNGEAVESVVEFFETDKRAGVAVLYVTRYTFFDMLANRLGGFTVTVYDPKESLLGKRMDWDLVPEKKGKYNRYFLKKMARLADEKLAGGA